MAMLKAELLKAEVRSKEEGCQGTHFDPFSVWRLSETGGARTEQGEHLGAGNLTL
jgi:hypothetical protein